MFPAAVWVMEGTGERRRGTEVGEKRVFFLGGNAGVVENGRE